MILAPFIPKKKFFILNTTNSLPLGIYYITTNPPTLDSIVAFNKPESLNILDRNWLVKGSLFLKKITAVPGDFVCTNNNQLKINGKFRGEIYKVDRNGIALPQIGFCRKLTSGEYWTGTDHRRSFDSRYYGPLRTQDISLKTVKPLWVM